MLSAILNGQCVPVGELSVPVSDSGFVLGVTVAEQVRTFDGKLYRLAEHMGRLHRSMDIIGVQLPYSSDSLIQMAIDLVASNWREMNEFEPAAVRDDGADHAAGPGDLGLSVFVTPGGYPTLEPDPSGPMLAMHTYPLPFQLWADKYLHGQRLSIVNVRQAPLSCWPAELKCRSRMHYYLADQEARAMDASSRALLLDTDGFVAETSTANLLIYNQSEGLLSPPPQKILPGISVAMVRDLATNLGIPFGHRDLTAEDVSQADEVILCSTSLCMLPVSHVDCQPVGPTSGGAFKPGPVFESILAAWSDEVGIDIRAQAIRYARGS